MLEVNAFGEIQSLKDQNGTFVIYPKRQVQINTCRGGAFVCCPVFGEASREGQWFGTSLPKHGLVRLLDENSAVDRRRVWRQDKLDESRFKIEFGDSSFFRWAHEVEIGILHRPLENLLIHKVDVRRSSSLVQKNLMPISVGFHPYFATHGGKFEVKMGNVVIADQTTELGSSIQGVNKQGLTLVTEKMIVRITGIGYDQWIVWSDNKREYVCLEPIIGRRQPNALGPSDILSLQTVITYKPV